MNFTLYAAHHVPAAHAAAGHFLESKGGGIALLIGAAVVLGAVAALSRNRKGAAVALGIWAATALASALRSPWFAANTTRGKVFIAEILCVPALALALLLVGLGSRGSRQPVQRSYYGGGY